MCGWCKGVGGFGWRLRVGCLGSAWDDVSRVWIVANVFKYLMYCTVETGNASF